MRRPARLVHVVSAAVLLAGAARSAEAQPPPPTLLTATATGALVTLTWATSSDHRTTYLVDAGSAPGLSDVVSGAPVTTQMGMVSAAQVPAGVYFVRMRAVLLDAVSGPSNELRLSVPGCPAPVPPAFRATASGQAVTIDWDASPLGCEPTALAIEVGSAPGAADLATFDIPDFHVRPRGYPNVPIGIYYLRARVTYPGYPAVTTNEVRLNVACVPPPGILNPRVRTVGNAAQFTWTPGSASGAAYSLFLDAGTSPGATDIGSLQVPTDAALGYNVAGAAGVYYTRFRAVNACGETTSPEVPVTLTSDCVPPDPLAFLDATSYTAAAPYDVTLLWDAPATGGLVLQYDMTAGTAPGAADLGAWTIDGRRAQPFALWTYAYRTGSPATYFTVLPVNHCGPASRPAEARAIAGTCRTPSAPRSTFASVNGNTVTLVWDGTGELETAYRTFVEVGSSPGSADVAVSPAIGSFGRPRFTITLPAGRYYARARRMSSFCDEVSNPSREVTFVVP